MTDSEINIAIAGACGWKDRPDPFYTDKLAWTHDEGATWVSTCDLPSYTTDINAMHEAEEVMWQRTDLWTLYVSELSKLCNSLAPALHATARQRAEAFLRVKGLWKEGA